jgi:hypothetical protein
MAFDLSDFVSLKRPDRAQKLGLKWERFTHLPDDETYLFVIGNDVDLTDINGDPFAERAQDIIDEYVDLRGPFSKKAAQRLSAAVSPVGRSKSDNFARWHG